MQTQSTIMSATFLSKHVMRYKIISEPVNYLKALRLQEYLQGMPNGRKNVVLFLQHPPTYTSGRRSKFNQNEHEKYSSFGADHFYAKRGGQMTCHSPGQLIVYPLLNLQVPPFNARIINYLLDSIFIHLKIL